MPLRTFIVSQGPRRAARKTKNSYTNSTTYLSWERITSQRSYFFLSLVPKILTIVGPICRHARKIPAHAMPPQRYTDKHSMCKTHVKVRPFQKAIYFYQNPTISIWVRWLPYLSQRYRTVKGSRLPGPSPCAVFSTLQRY